MSGASKQGTKLVVLAVGGTLGALGIGTIYLPFFADRDRVRGLHEESDLTNAERAEYERVMKEMGAMRASDENQHLRGPPHNDRMANSMWIRMNKAAANQPR